MIEFVTGLAAVCVITGLAACAIYRGKIETVRKSLRYVMDSAKVKDKQAEIFAERLCDIIGHFSKGKSGTARLVVKMAKGEQ